MSTLGFPEMESPSILDDLGEEVTGIMAPVSLCMAITVVLVRLLNPDGSGSSSNSVIIASLAYSEDSEDTNSQKFSGAVLNAIIFAGIMAVMTFILVLLFKYGCFRVIYTYMAFAVFDIFFLITAIVSLQVLQTLEIHVDAFSFVYGLWNFAIVGTVGILFIPMPLLAKQFYMLWTGVITAYIFTWVPEWTSWVLIVVMALYDIAAVLIPGGPLNMLVKVATERQEMLPALIYEARPARGTYVPNQLTRRAPGDNSSHTLPQPGGAPPESEAHEALMLARDNSVAGSGQNSPMHHPNSGAGYMPPDVADATAGKYVAVSGESSRPSSPRLAMAPGGGPLVTGGSAQVVPLPAPTRPSSGGSSRRQDGQEMTATSRFAQSASPRPTTPTVLPASGSRPSSARSTQGASGDADAVAGLGAGAVGGAVGGGGGRPLGEGLEDDGPALGAYKALPSALPYPPGPGRENTEPLALLQDHGNLSSPPPLVQDGRGGSGGALGPLGGDNMRHQPNNSSDRPSRGPSNPAALTADAPAPLNNNTGAVHWGNDTPVPGGGGSGGAPPHQPADVEIELPDSIKLGLGDFIFYSMLVGRAAMYDYMTVFASYLGIIAGLGITLICLAAYQRALPALPFSIALGVLFYFLTRLVLEPYIVPLAASLTYY